MLTLSQVCKSYGDTPALHSTDLSLEPGSTTILIGPSGCGKSTILRLVAGLTSPDAGSVFFEGNRLTRESLQMARLRMGYVIQEGGLFPHLSVRDNVTVMARYLSRETAWIDERLAELAELVHLPDRLMPRFPAELSGGQRQRVSLMRALMLDPDLLLLDEPLGALDPMIRFRLQNDLRSIFEQLGKTVLMVTHDIAEAVHFGGVLVLMKRGRVVQRGSFAELVRDPAEPFVEEFITAQKEPLNKLMEALA
jgi:osmoprotectant transport system ATP-binding protein